MIDDIYDCLIEFDRKIIGVDFDGRVVVWGEDFYAFFLVFLLSVTTNRNDCRQTLLTSRF